ncbi:MAG: hypothetical protein V3R82_04855 [Candidatus Hydrothermarchaeales archaeon]
MDIRYKGLPLRPTRSVYNELKNSRMDLYDVLQILKDGYDCSTSRRKKGTFEKCLDFKNKTIKVVVVKSFEFWSKQEVYVIVHVGKFTKRK